MSGSGQSSHKNTYVDQSTRRSPSRPGDRTSCRVGSAYRFSGGQNCACGSWMELDVGASDTMR
ncbi:hypothetical protein RSAG8_09425, partial [Rhizoctonia solani AG-8 WAC10335]